MRSGPHGMIEGEIDENTKELKVKFIPVDEKEFKEIEMDITGISTKEELIEKINETEMPNNSYIKITFVGNKNLEIETTNILKHLENPNIVKIKNKTKLEINLDTLKMQNNLKGIFVRKLLEKIEEEPENREKIERAIEIGLSNF